MKIKKNKSEKLIEYLINYMSEIKAEIASLQEININNKDNITFKHYDFIKKCRKNKPGGGMGILLNKKYNYQEIKIKNTSPLEIIGIKTIINKKEYNIFSLYTV